MYINVNNICILMPGYHVTISSFGSLPSSVKVANSNSIRVNTTSTRSISSLSSALSIINQNAVITGVKINRGALLDDNLKDLIQTIQQKFINTYMDFSCVKVAFWRGAGALRLSL